MRTRTHNYRSRTPRLFLGGALVLLVGLMQAAPVLAQAGNAGIRPANPRPDNPRTNDIWVHTADPGEVIADGLRAINNSEEETTLLIYPVDQELASSAGSFACEQRSQEKDAVGSWVALEGADEAGEVTVTLAPETEKTIPFVLNVPETADVGEHNGCMVVETLTGGGIGIGSDSEPQEGGAQLRFRRAVRIAMLIPGDIERALQPVDLIMTPKQNGNLNFKPVVKNTGNVSIDADVLVPIKNRVLRNRARTLGDTFVVLRGTESEWNLELEPLFWGGWYEAQLQVSYDPRPDAQLGVRDESEFITVTGPTETFYANPAPLAVGIYVAMLILLLVITVWMILMARQKKWIRTAWVKYGVQGNEDIQAVAKAHDVSWKLLAKANKLEAPYSISEGQELIVPPTVQESVASSQDSGEGNPPAGEDEGMKAEEM